MIKMEELSHSVVHYLRRSRCKTPWAELRINADGSRFCGECESKILQPEDLDDEQFAEILASHRKVLRRLDETIILEKHICQPPVLMMLVASAIAQVATLCLVPWLAIPASLILAFVGVTIVLIGALSKKRHLITTGRFAFCFPSMLVWGLCYARACLEALF